MRQNPVAYNLDTLNQSVSGVIITKPGNELDFTNCEVVNRFSPEYIQPAGTSIYMAFRYSDSAVYFRLKSDGTAESINTSEPDFDTLSQSGNTMSELTALTNIPAFAGKKFTLP